MTKVAVYYRQKDIVKIEVQGHTNFANHGEDIVCSGISTLVFSVINFLEQNQNFKHNINEQTTNITLEMIESNPEVTSYFNYLAQSLETIHQNYPQNLKIRSYYD